MTFEKKLITKKNIYKKENFWLGKKTYLKKNRSLPDFIGSIR